MLFPMQPSVKITKYQAVGQRDFIYRETDENGIEILSIMFEMKNEADETKTKHKTKILQRIR